MYCKKCGHHIDQGEKFCRKCGEKVSMSQMEEKANRGKKVWIPVGVITAILAIVLILQNLSILPLVTEIGVKAPYNQEVGYDTPEETINRFAEAIANNDAQGALELFACRHITDNYDYAAFIERMQSWQPQSRYAYSTPEGIFRESTFEMLRGEAARQIFNVCFSLNASGDYLEMKPIMDESIDQIVTDLGKFTDLDQLNTFRIVRSDYTQPETQNLPAHKENVKVRCKYMGAEDWVEYSILYEYDGQTYFGGMSLIQYDSKWYIENLIGVLAGQTAYAYLEPISETEYCEKVGV